MSSGAGAVVAPGAAVGEGCPGPAVGVSSGGEGCPAAAVGVSSGGGATVGSVVGVGTTRGLVTNSGGGPDMKSRATVIMSSARGRSPALCAYVGGYEVAGRAKHECGRRRDPVPVQVEDVPRAGDGGGGVVHHRVGEFVQLYDRLGLRSAVDADGDYLEVEGLELPVPLLQLDELTVANRSEITPIKDDGDRLLADVVGAIQFAASNLRQRELGESAGIVTLNKQESFGRCERGCRFGGRRLHRFRRRIGRCARLGVGAARDSRKRRSQQSDQRRQTVLWQYPILASTCHRNSSRGDHKLAATLRNYLRPHQV